jgi:hypothetical protein
MLAVLCAIVATSLAYSCYAAIYSPAAAFYSPLSRLWELGSGGILFIVTKHRRDNNVLSLFGLALILASAALLDKTSTFPGFAAMPSVAGSALVIASGSTILARKLPEQLGRISYPLYLWHWPLLVLAATNGMNSTAQRLIVVAVSLALSFLTYRLLEKPIRFGRLRRTGVVASCAVTVGVACVSILALFDHRPDRYSAEIRPVLALVGYNPETDARYPSCWASEKASFESYAAECRNGDIMLWGDSHAARLYTGFKNSGIPAAQFTRSGCMPSLVTDRRSLCDESNTSIVEEIERSKPHRVIIFAAWLNHGVNWQLGDERVESIRRAVERLKRTVDDVIILGPAPFWDPDLPIAAIRFWDANQILPDRLQPADKNYHAVDAILAAIARQQGARFISAFDEICNVAGCLTHTSASRSDLLSWDYGHLTTSGAHYLLQALRMDELPPGSRPN